MVSKKEFAFNDNKNDYFKKVYSFCTPKQEDDQHSKEDSDDIHNIIKNLDFSNTPVTSVRKQKTQKTPRFTSDLFKENCSFEITRGELVESKDSKMSLSINQSKISNNLKNELFLNDNSNSFEEIKSVPAPFFSQES